MNKTIAALATGTLVLALGLALVAPVSAQVTTGTYNTTMSSTTTGSTGSTDNSTASTTTGTTGVSGSGSTTAPGLPNTGAGGDAAMNFAILLSSGLIAVGATVLLARKLAA